MLKRAKRSAFRRSLLIAVAALGPLGLVPEGAAERASAAPSERSPPSEGFGPEALDALSDLSEEERTQLLKGGLVVRKVEFEHAGATYAGGVSYALVEARPLEVLSALRQPGALRKAMPSTVEARVLGEVDGVSRVSFVQGSPPLVGRYSVMLRWEPAQGRARFWLDPERPHDLKDIWGYLRVTELRPGQTLMTWAVALDLGQGVFGSMFERPVQAEALRAPSTIRGYMNSSRAERPPP